jgi:[ribosomal protein S5]-alanine N-acetyltransferase
MTGPEFTTIETRRLVLRPLAISDAPAIYAYQSDAEVYRYMSPEPPASADAVAEPIGGWLALPVEDRRPCWVIVLREVDCVVGTISFNQLDRKNSNGQLGYEVAREQWGKGIGTEAVRAVLNYGFGTMGLNRIAGYCWEGNVASRRVMEKAGMTYEGTLRQLRYAKGAYRDMRFYSVLASEWQAKQGVPTGGGSRAGGS